MTIEDIEQMKDIIQKRVDDLEQRLRKEVTLLESELREAREFAVQMVQQRDEAMAAHERVKNFVGIIVKVGRELLDAIGCLRGGDGCVETSGAPCAACRLAFIINQSQP